MFTGFIVADFLFSAIFVVGVAPVLGLRLPCFCLLFWRFLCLLVVVFCRVLVLL